MEMWRLTDLFFHVIRGAVLLAALFAVPGKPMAQVRSADTIVTVLGSCSETVKYAGRPFPCTGTGLVFMALKNGRVVITFAVGERRAISFIGESDQQVRPEEYVLYLNRGRLASRGSDQVVNVSGTCRITMSRDGRFWSHIRCDATDEDHAAYRLRFRGNREPVDVRHAR